MIPAGVQVFVGSIPWDLRCSFERLSENRERAVSATTLAAARCLCSTAVVVTR